jgi:hypothetical protein
MIHTFTRGIRPFKQFVQIVVAASALIALANPSPAFARAASPGVFLPVTSYDSGGSFSKSVAVADVDEDGTLDVLVANCAATENGCYLATENGTVAVLLGNEDGTLKGATNYPAGGIGTQSLTASDVNGDGHVDLMVVNLFSHTVSVLLGNGDGTFQVATLFSSGGVYPTSIAVADLNGDSKADLVVTNGCNAVACSGGAVGVLLGNGDGTFQAAIAYVGFNAKGLTVADVNDDGELDVIVASGFFTVNVLLGKGDGTLSSAVSYDAGGFGSSAVMIADLNQDRRPDIVVSNCAPSAANGCGGTSANGVVGVLLGNANGTFRSVITFDSDGKADTQLRVADVDGDRKLDVLVTHSCDASGNCGAGTVSILPGRGDGTLAPAVTHSAAAPSRSGTNSLALADLDGDGDLDLLVASGNTVGVLLHRASPGHVCRPKIRHGRGHHWGRRF